jgi:hypothetical protein
VTTLRSKAEIDADLSVDRVPADDRLRRCTECEKILSQYNKHPSKCFLHQLSLREQTARREKEPKHAYPNLTPESRAKQGFRHVSIEYHGSPKDL